jgi:hypothetical protein
MRRELVGKARVTMLRHLPMLLTIAGVASIVIAEWLRHRSYLKHRKSGFVPGTQGIAMVGTFVAAGCFLAAIALRLAGLLW